ncbi:hypothetical protein FOA43_002687 [Brettanomyces nanus]|uniref:GPI mannosyltransferase 1 n=1 Tax=Eeniella nana TaxID=13502 RepID=A0A875S886_EENNA|nr:uncharacterized protein FOA43_002687 [Brettanomyces nanus]QPG75334.1 hypothetical protein FOA43_002687 [Brettanomyces nanus]
MDVDYYVFTDAARFIYNGQSPYLRATYRYTPLLGWLLVPTAWQAANDYWFEFGKAVFVVCDLITGYLILRLLILMHKDTNWSLLWFFNPMVITISTRGSSESLLTAVVMAAVYRAVQRKNWQAGLWLGLAIHLKIYPFLYVPSILLFIDAGQPLWKPITRERVKFLLGVLVTFCGLTYLMFHWYGQVYLDEAFLYHLIRLDHRHNFSIYNISLYFTSFTGKSALFDGGFTLEKMAFLPQLALSAVLIPLRLCYGNYKPEVLVSSLFIQTFTFIAFNKVITSQYFVWFMCFLPVYLSLSTISLFKGVILLAGWIITQALWLYYGYRLEFRGEFDLFYSGLWTSATAMFIWNCVLIAEFIRDVTRKVKRD